MLETARVEKKNPQEPGEGSGLWDLLSQEALGKSAPLVMVPSEPRRGFETKTFPLWKKGAGFPPTGRAGTRGGEVKRQAGVRKGGARKTWAESGPPPQKKKIFQDPASRTLQKSSEKSGTDKVEPSGRVGGCVTQVVRITCWREKGEVSLGGEGPCTRHLVGRGGGKSTATRQGSLRQKSSPRFKEVGGRYMPQRQGRCLLKEETLTKQLQAAFSEKRGGIKPNRPLNSEKKGRRPRGTAVRKKRRLERDGKPQGPTRGRGWKKRGREKKGGRGGCYQAPTFC